MFNALGIVEAHLGGDPLKGKAARRLGGKPLLEWVVRRFTECQRLDRVIVLAQRGPQQHLVAELVPSDIPVFTGPSDDVLSNYQAALEAYPARAIVRMGADAPFVDPVLVDRLVSTADDHPQCDYVGYCRRDGRPAILSSVGLFAEWIRAEAVYAAARQAVGALRHSPAQHVLAHPEQFTIRLIPAPAGLEDVRLTVQSEEDWDNAQTVYEALGPEALEWQRIAGLLEQQPELRSRMLNLNHGLESV